MKQAEPDPDCPKCRHHYVTYEAAWPQGCRAFEFKSRGVPALLVRENSGEPCRAFEERGRPARP